jgi:ATP-dependent exoDNAse (exonuclease V) beta subunit
MWADLFEPYKESEMDLQQRLLYVALTRASDFLIATHSKPNVFIEKIIATGDIICNQITHEEKLLPEKSDVTQKDKPNSLEEIRMKFPNAYAIWSTDDDDKLEQLFHAGKNVKELAIIFQRQESAIRSRLKKMKLKS